MKHHVSTFALAAALVAGVTPSPAGAAERPAAMRVFPSRTVLFVRTADAGELSERFHQSIAGRALADPEVAPLADAVQGIVDERFAEGPGEATGGTTLTELLSFFNGEAAFGMVSRPNKSPAVLVLIDTVSIADRASGDPEALADGTERLLALLERFRDNAANEGMTVATEEIGSVEATVFRKGDNAEDAGAWIERDGAVLIGTDREVLAAALANWDGDPPSATDYDEEGRPPAYVGTLADNPAFTESLRQCVEERLGSDTTPPQLIAFVDPIGLFRSAAQGNAGMRVALATFPALGLDGLEGAAGAVWYGAGDWDSLIRGHLLLDTPRSGVLKILRLAACDPTPGPAVPADIASYYVGAVDPVAVLTSAGALHDKIRGEGTFAALVRDNVTKHLGVEPRVLLEHLTGRGAWITGFGEGAPDEPARGSAVSAFLLRVHDADKAAEALKEVLGRFENIFVWSEHHDVPYVWLKVGSHEVSETGEPQELQQDRPCFAIVGDSLVIGQTPAFLRRLIDTHAGETPRLSDHLPFRLVINRTKRLSRERTDEGRLLTYEDPSEQFRRWIATANDEESRAAFDKIAEQAPPLRVLRDAIDEAGLPTVETLLKYAAPGGSAVYDTPSGFRYVAFQFRREE